jgi:hypothetical protein
VVVHPLESLGVNEGEMTSSNTSVTTCFTRSCSQRGPSRKKDFPRARGLERATIVLSRSKNAASISDILSSVCGARHSPGRADMVRCHS